MSSTTIIQTETLSKTYKGKVQALNQLNLSVNRGEVFGYLGPNGAGKTTTIRLLLDLIRPTAGHARVFDIDVNQDSRAIRARIGYLPGELNLWDRRTAMQVIRYVGSVRGGVDMRYVQELAGRLQFDLTKKVRSYSTGNKRKLGLILALMNKPELLILDEPTSGLDPLMQQTFYEIVRETRADGRTVFLSSHILSEVQAICDRVGILRGGVLQAVQRVDQLTQADFRNVTIRFREPVDGARLRALTGISSLSIVDSTAQFQLAGDFDPLLRAVQDLYIVSMEVEKPSLEEVFLKFYDKTPSSNHRAAQSA
ncbi:MAG: ABC transporter ATP-binding protein [Anaerolineae bacterium]|nr:ABC transporter ATP-binding protein [Anaerolineae bacterium]NUQ03710.1 ABC transporter ATP-binding protein [Anaerolineae bacterium]